MCESCDKIEAEKERVIAAVKQTQPSCLVCESPNAGNIGTWIAGKEHRLAVGDTSTVSVFGFWLCDSHAEITEKNEKLITQIIVQEVSHGKPRQI